MVWDKWALAGDRNSYAVFSDAYADRDRTGLYIYVLRTDDGRRKVGKFAIIR